LSQARLDGKTVVVTGCNVGIGFETAKVLTVSAVIFGLNSKSVKKFTLLDLTAF
jgi:NAD(P)-dependent dehydrogenase (short-subunit alcohol dehydrogenase family)